jgi:hypothetical protein
MTGLGNVLNEILAKAAGFWAWLEPLLRDFASAIGAVIDGGTAPARQVAVCLLVLAVLAWVIVSKAVKKVMGK